MKDGDVLGGQTILLVEDEFLILLDLQYLLERAGADVMTATSVAEGLSKADQSFDAAVLDVRLPDGEVYPLAERLAEGAIPLIFHSGHAQVAELRKKWPTAVALEKPAHESLLLDAVARQTERGTRN